MTGHVVFRCDAGATIGGGHAMRCLALAGAFATEGWRRTVATRRESLGAVPALESAGALIALGDDADEEPDAIGTQIAPCDLLVVDHYQRGSAFEQACRPWARRILVIDDAPTRDHDCDLLVCPTPPWEAADFGPRLPDGAITLTGPAYAPLRGAFADRRFAPAPAAGPADPRLLIAFGATDPANATTHVLRTLSDAGVLDAVSVDVLLGAAAPHRANVASIAAELPSVRLHIDPPDPVDLIARADLTIGAAGTMAWERCALARAAVLISIADNQVPGSAFLTNAGAAIDLGPLHTLVDATLVATIRDLLADPAKRERLSDNAAALCDGLGARRIVAAASPPRATDGATIALRPVTMADSDTILAWQRHPETRRFARNPEVPDAATQAAWMARTLHDPHRILSLILHGGAPAGVVRLDRLDGPVDERYEISILIDPARKRLGLGRAALDLAHRLRPEATLIASVLPENDASNALFRGAGYAPSDGGYRHAPRAFHSTETTP